MDINESFRHAFTPISGYEDDADFPASSLAYATQAYHSWSTETAEHVTQQTQESALGLFVPKPEVSRDFDFGQEEETTRY
ncbi:hypothetical protein V866_005610 [Kwoniella sp. B9012]